MEYVVLLQSLVGAPDGLAAVPLVLIGAYFAAGGGVLLALSVKLLASAIISIPGQFLYAFKHRRAITFSIGSRIRNFAYGRSNEGMEVASVRLLSKTSSGQPAQSGGRIRTALIIPGTWSGPKYAWARWDQCRKGLEAAGVTVYGLCWESGNNELSRVVAAENVSKWLDEAKFPVGSVALIGHSYGGQVAAMAADHSAVERAVTIAAPFVFLRRLNKDEIASGAMAVLSRFVLLTSMLFGLLISAPHTGLDVLWPTISWNTCESVGIAIVLAGFGYGSTIAGVLGAMWRRQLIVDLPPNSRTVMALRVDKEEILDEMLDASLNACVEPGSSPAFVEQKSLRREQVKKWFLPLYVWCAVLELIWLAMATDGKALPMESLRQYGLAAALRGFFYVISFTFLLACASSTSKMARDTHALMRDLLGLVDHAALVRFNRRKVVAWIAGLTSHEMLVYDASIEASHGLECEQRRINMPNERWTLRDGRRSLLNGRHSKAIEDSTMTDAVLAALCLASSPSPHQDG
ncbi:hypothetical protein [Achromobacter aegrifaciens]